MKFYVLSTLILLLLTGCVNEPHEESPLLLEEGNESVEVQDLEFFPQNISPYLHNLKPHTSLLTMQKTYDDKYFEPWHYTKPPFKKEDILWPFSSYTYDKSFGDNLKPIREEWFIKMKDKGNYEAYGSLNKKAISLHYLSLRNFPTHKPVYKDPSLAGEGFPFDYMQNSGVHANEPLFVSHFSKDGQWVYVFTTYATGWVKKSDISFLTKRVTTSWEASRQVELVQEHYPIKDLKGNFIFQSRVGMRLALISVDKDSYTALAITSGMNNKATYTEVRFPLHIAKEGKLLLNKDNLKHITGLMMQSHYGWGGLFEEKDCSSMLRDLYAPFGIWLPRNSSQQAKIGKIISLENLSLDEKKKKIIEQGIAFETLLYKKGHILLYLGTFKGEISVLQNVWGVKTMTDGVEGRKVIGRVIISSLELGKERDDYNAEKGILARLSSMNIITQSPIVKN